MKRTTRQGFKTKREVNIVLSKIRMETQKRGLKKEWINKKRYNIFERTLSTMVRTLQIDCKRRYIIKRN